MNDSIKARQWPLLLASTLTVMAGAALAPALPTLQAVFADDPNAGFLTRQLLTVPALFIVLAAPLAGWLTDRMGRVRLATASLLLYVLAGCAGALLNELPSILATRALLGVAVAGLMTSVTTLIADYFDGSERDAVYGRQGAFMSFGGVLFLVAGGLMVDLHWRASFLVYAAPLLLLWSLARLPEPAAHHEVHTGPADPFPMAKVALIFAAGLIGMMVFYVIPVQLPYHLVAVTEASGRSIGFTLALSNVAGTVAGLSFARIRTRLGPLQIITLIYLLMATGYALIAAAQGYAMIMAGLALAGFGLGMTVPNLTTWLSGFVATAWRGRLMGGLTAAVYVGQFLSPLAAQPFVNGYGTAGPFWACTVLLLLLAPVAWSLRHRA
jgi:MFS family permease